MTGKIQMKKQSNRSTKAYLIRAASCVLLLVSICLLSFAATQNHNNLVPAGTNLSAGKQLTSTDISRPTAPLALEAVLYDQFDNASQPIGCTNFIDSPNFSVDIADDFIVPAGETWTVQAVDVQGRYFNGSGPAFSFNVFVYADNATLPGAVVYSAPNQAFTQVGPVDRRTVSVNLSVPAVLPAGTYWIEVQANSSFSNGIWSWSERTVQSGNGAVEQNPGGGVLGNCARTWIRKITCSAASYGPDQVFRLNGTIGGCVACHKGSLTIDLPCNSMEYRRHLDHGDTIGACSSSKKPSGQADSLGRG
jgi:hypothetical protein